MRFGTGLYKGTRLLAAFLILAGAALLISSSDTPPFTQHDKAFYASEATVNFVRPGLIQKTVGHEILADGTVKARVKMTDPKGLPLDRLGITTPGTISTSFILASIPKGQAQYVAYTTRTQTSPITGNSAVQAGADSGGTWTTVAEGEYIYTFAKKLPADYDKTATHTISIYGSRNLTEFDLGTNYDDDVYNFVPDGSPVTVVRDLIKTATCNKCHYDLGLHGGSRKTMENCVLCHTPQTVDPDTGNTVDMKVMIHKIHTGKALPSVIAGTPYKIIGNSQSVHDYSEIGFPAESGTGNCTVCHESGMGAKQENLWLTNPTRASCGSCHDTVNFATGEGHVGLPQATDNLCKTCHIPEGEIDFDASIKGAHVVETHSSLLKGINTKITSVDNGKAGQKPVVNFTLTDDKGNALDPSKLNRIAITLAGTTVDYGTGPTVGTTGYVTEVAATAKPIAGGFQYAMTTTIPADAKGTFSVSIEARDFEKVLVGTLKEKEIEYGAVNPTFYFSVDGSAVAKRRAIVDMKKCNNCHEFLSLHGTNRNQIEYCVVCHNPKTTDVSRRTAALLPAEGIDFSLMIHRIHAGTSQIRDYTIYGFGGSANNYNKIGFPAELNACTMCHIDNTWNVPVQATLDKVDPRGFLNPAKPVTAACTGCHTSVDAASHALANTTTLGESCGACHGANSDFAVTKVHAQ